MGLLPLEFTDCLQDSPYFRDSLHAHEKELERTSNSIKELIKETKNLLQAAKTLSSAQRRLSQTLVNFKFECIGNNQTDDEIWIAGSLKEFGKLIAAIEDEKDKLLDRAYEQFIVPLENFRKEQIGAVRERKKKFEKQTAKFCASQERYLALSTKKQDTVLQEADAQLEMEHRDFVRAALEYVDLIQEVQEKKKFEFVEILLGFMYSWLTFYHSGHEVAKDFRPHMTELQGRIQKSRENFNSSRADIKALMRKMLEVRQPKPIDPGTLNKMYTRSGYLFLMEKKALGTTWSKCYCHYQRESRLFKMIPYVQTAGKIISTETFHLRSCVKRVTETIDKRFCFDLLPEEKPGVVYTFQALSEEDRDLWLDAMDGKEPMYAVPPKPSDANQTYLDEAGFNFVERCLQVLENRGLEDQGLYRVVGVASKVTKLLTIGLDKRKSDKLNLDDQFEFESKTITSAVKTFFRNLPEPIMTFRLHTSFISAAKLETYSGRVSEVQRLAGQLPEPNKRMLEILMSHLEKVARNCKRNMMTVSNLAVCFGPTLLRAEEETVAAIMDIKFANVIVEILIENWRQIFRGEPPLHNRRVSAGESGLVVLPVETSPGQLNVSNNSGKHQMGPSVSPRGALHLSPKRPPPPYPQPPPPPQQTSSTSSLGQALAYTQSQRSVSKPVNSSNVSPPGLRHSASNTSLTNSYSSATWERSVRTSATNLVPPPLGSAPPPSTAALSPYNNNNLLNHQRVHGSTSNLETEQSEHRQRPSVKTRTQVSRQLSAGQASLLSSHSGGPPTPLSAAEFYGEDQMNSASTQPLHQRASHQRKTSARSQGSSSSSIDSITSSSSREVSSFDGAYTQESQPSRIVEDELEAAAREAAAAAAAAVAASSATIRSIGKSWTPGSTPGPVHVEDNGRLVYQEDPYSVGTPYIRPQSEIRPPQSRTQYIPSYPIDSALPSEPTSSSASSTSSGVPPVKPRSSVPPKSVELRRVRTLFACVGEHESELSFEPNQIITSIRPSAEPGWLEGNLDGKYGLVPENYVEFIP